MTEIPILIGALDTISERRGKGTESLGNKRINEDHPNYSIIKVGQNTKESPAELKRLAITHAPVKKQSDYVYVKNSQRNNNSNCINNSNNNNNNNNNDKRPE